MATKQDIQINTLQIMMEQNTTEHKEMKEMILSFGKKLDSSLNKMESKFAGKWVEKILVGFFILVGTGVCSYLGTLIYKAAIHLI
ncbi:MAG: hypothetical protein WCN88_04845 [Candidatus Falkowbacteria bacterium]